MAEAAPRPKDKMELTAEQEDAFMRYFPTANIRVADSHRARRIFQAGWQAALRTISSTP